MSGRMPNDFSGLGADIIKSLTLAGHNVQFGFDGIEDFIKNNLKPSKDGRIQWLYGKLHFYIRKFFNSLIDYLPRLKFIYKDGRAIYSLYEDQPGIPVNVVLERLHGDFDLCIFLFDHGLFTTKTYKAIYDRFHCPIIINAVDLLPITGGCYYFGNCNNYTKGCGNCPIMGGLYKNDQTHKNFEYKKKVYDNIECVFLGNTWMLRHAEKSRMFEKSLMRKVSFNLDESVFKPLDVERCREKLGIPLSKKHVFLYRYRKGNWRKGEDIMIKGVNDLYSMLSPAERKEVLIVLISEKLDNAEEVIKMDVLQLGYVDDETLIVAYNAASAFLCSSIEDAGPSMINQAMACGTPVIAFDTGTAIDVIENDVNGYKTPLSEKERWGDGLLKICHMSETDYREMREQARKTALEKNSLGAFAKAIEDIYREFRPEGKR